MQSKAQYFQEYYNEPPAGQHDNLKSGYKSSYNNQISFVSCGIHVNGIPPNINHCRVLRSTQTGAPVFNYGFNVADAATPTIYHNSLLDHIIEYMNGANPMGLYAVGGTATNTYLGSVVAGGGDVLITKFFNNGAINWTKSIDLNGGNDHAYCIKQSTVAPDKLYITGTTRYPGGDAETFVIKMDTAGVINWTTNVDFNMGVAHSRENIGRYLVEDIFGAVWVAGSSRVVGSADYQGLVFNITNAGNVSLTQRYLFDYGNSDERFYSIRKTNSGDYILGGFTNKYNAPQLSDMFLLKINLNAFPPVPLWDGVYQTNVNSSTSNDSCFDVIERIPTNRPNQPEYYAVGVCQDAMLPTTFETVLKVDLNGIPLGVFAYGNPLNQPNTSYGKAIDIINPGNVQNGGYVTFGTYFINNQLNSHITKAYFNGVSGCQDRVGGYGYHMNNGLLYSMIINAPTIQVNNTTNLTPTLLTANATNQCYNLNVGGGNNYKTGLNEETEKTNNITAYPNPIDFTNELHLKLTANENAIYTIEVLDAMGRSVLLAEKNISTGDNDFTLKLPELNAGIYFLKVNSPDKQSISKLIKQ